jgi:hypothetical protein
VARERRRKRSTCAARGDVLTDEGRQQPFAPSEYLYHYTTMETLLQYVLPNGTIKLSPYTSVRDPLEVKKHIQISPPSEEQFREMYAQVQARERAAASPDVMSGGQIDEESFQLHVGMVTKHMRRAAWELVMLVPRVWHNTYAHPSRSCLLRRMRRSNTTWSDYSALATRVPECGSSMGRTIVVCVCASTDVSCLPR